MLQQACELSSALALVYWMQGLAFPPGSQVSDAASATLWPTGSYPCHFQGEGQQYYLRWRDLRTDLCPPSALIHNTECPFVENRDKDN